jgi:hypothetical protein
MTVKEKVADMSLPVPVHPTYLQSGACGEELNGEDLQGKDTNEQTIDPVLSTLLANVLSKRPDMAANGRAFILFR